MTDLADRGKNKPTATVEPSLQRVMGPWLLPLFIVAIGSG